MSFHDFCILTPGEIDEVLRCRGRIRTEEARRDWEVMRLQTFMTISPFCDKIGTPKNLLPFPWDDDEEDGNTSEGTTVEERKANGSRLRKKLGW